jgi:hypothetical protein
MRFTMAQYWTLNPLCPESTLFRVDSEPASTPSTPTAKLSSSRLQGDVTVNGSMLPEDVLRDAPSYTPRPYELADLELLLSGAYAPLTGFLGRADLTALRRTGRLADGTAWPVAVTVEIPAEMADRLDLDDPLHRTVVLTDPEGAPVAAVEVNDAWPTKDGLSAIGGAVDRGALLLLALDGVAVEGFQEQGVLVAERVVEAAAADAHAVHEVLHGGLLVAALPERVERAPQCDVGVELLGAHRLPPLLTEPTVGL